MAKPLSGSRKWPTSQWEKLLSLALPVLSDLPNEITWALGGGTGLALSLNHRESFDIDIFFDRTSSLKLIAKNPKTMAISSDRQFPGNYLKLIRDEGDIDFIAASNVLDEPSIDFDFHGTLVQIEAPSEIIAKKIRYRGSRFTARDVFDLAAAFDNDPRLIDRLSMDISSEDFERALDRTRLLNDNLNIRDSISPTPEGKSIIDRVFDIAIHGLEVCIYPNHGPR